MKQSRREKEKEILRQMKEGLDQANANESASDSPKKKKEQKNGDDEIIRCPQCGYVLTSRGPCGRCGYSGYVPLSEKQTKRIKLILYPILLVIAVLFYLYKMGYLG